MLKKSLILLLGGTLLFACGNSDDDNTGGNAGSESGGSAGTGGTSNTGGSAGAKTGGSAGAKTGGSAGTQTGGSAGAQTGGSAGEQTGGSAGAQTGGSAGAQTGGSAGEQTGGSAGSGGEVEPCVTITFDLHASPQYFVTLEDMQTHSTAPDKFSFMMQKVPGPGPVVYLGVGMQGVNLGADLDFDNVTEAPASGYATDEADSPVIGRTYKSGGSGQTGFIMTNNVYVLKHPDGSYSKLSWVSAKKGVIVINAFHSDSTDLTCKW